MPSIRQFLEYYLLLFPEKGRGKREIVDEIKERSGGNRPFRPTGVLWPAIRMYEMHDFLVVACQRR